MCVDLLRQTANKKKKGGKKHRAMSTSNVPPLLMRTRRTSTGSGSTGMKTVTSTPLRVFSDKMTPNTKQAIQVRLVLLDGWHAHKHRQRAKNT